MDEPQKILEVSILLAGTPIPKVIENFGHYGEQISTLLQNAIHSSKQKLSLRIRNYDVVNMEFPEEKDLLETNGIIITGSASSAYEDVPWINRLVDFTKLVIDKHQHIKLIGVCFGHQIVARAVGFTPKSPIQGMIKGNQILTVQGHPEFVSGVVKLMTYDRLDKGIFAPEFAHTALEAADDKDDGLLIGQRFIEFMTG
ncbi:6262_t:CDS:2 [Racocetra fulgida]|uniref:6262_t:CDS:1 n=1 Tax=Racocetra fulgida TaxID=60492 RepID=A0A9N8Z2C4_9GLOM|nr:6262_t:CDS:2 [Racocetra fulgida]